MIKIILTNSREVTFEPSEYTDYMYDGKFFIIKKLEKWIAMYNVEHIISVNVID